jgi:hypothetical protein
MSKRAFYHRATILFEATREFSREELCALFRCSVSKDIVTDSVQCEEVIVERGEPGLL